jgi:chromosome segregation ATPase
VKEELARSVESHKATLREVEVTGKERDAAVQRLATLEAAHQMTCNRLQVAERELAASRAALQTSEAKLEKAGADNSTLVAGLLAAVERGNR